MFLIDECWEPWDTDLDLMLCRTFVSVNDVFLCLFGFNCLARFVSIFFLNNVGHYDSSNSKEMVLDPSKYARISQSGLPPDNPCYYRIYRIIFPDTNL